MTQYSTKRYKSVIIRAHNIVFQMNTITLLYCSQFMRHHKAVCCPGVYFNI